MTEIINQTKSNSCMACVMAMMVDESEQYVLDWFENDDPPFCDEDAYLFLAHHGIYLVALADFTKISEDGKGVSVAINQSFQINFNLSTHKAYIVVDSPSKNELTHAVFWDGEKVLDPLCDKPQKIEDYKVQHIYPLLTTKQRMIKQENAE